MSESIVNQQFELAIKEVAKEEAIKQMKIAKDYLEKKIIEIEEAKRDLVSLQGMAQMYRDRIINLYVENFQND